MVFNSVSDKQTIGRFSLDTKTNELTPFELKQRQNIIKVWEDNKNKTENHKNKDSSLLENHIVVIFNTNDQKIQTRFFVKK